MIYLTGDTHGRFERIGAFCDKMQTDRDDTSVLRRSQTLSNESEERFTAIWMFLYPLN